MVEIIFGAIFLLTTLTLAVFIRQQKLVNKKSERLFNTIVESITIQQGINDKQSGINELLSKNMEIVGVHTKLIKPSVTMEAEAFLRWHNERKEEKDGEI